MDLLSEWAKWKPKGPPFVMDADRELLVSDRSELAVATFHSWRTAISDPDFGKPKDTRVHLGLLPMPFVGNLTRASIFVLQLNPGLGPHDYFGEHEVRAYRKALLRNLKQRFDRKTIPFLFLDPQFSWHGGYRYWHDKLKDVIAQLAKKKGFSFAQARERLAKEFACLELFPYHSSTFKEQDGWLKKLRSVTLARQFLSEKLLPRARKGEALVIVTRKVKHWDTAKCRGVICYDGVHARGAHLSPNSSGGKAILKWLLSAS